MQLFKARFVICFDPLHDFLLIFFLLYRSHSVKNHWSEIVNFVRLLTDRFVRWAALLMVSWFSFDTKDCKTNALMCNLRLETILKRIRHRHAFRSHKAPYDNITFSQHIQNAVQC